MAKRFGKEGSAGMRGPLWGAFCYLISSKLALSYISLQAQAESQAKNRRGKGGRGEEKTLTSATCLSFESTALQLKCVCAEGAGDWHNRV